MFESDDVETTPTKPEIGEKDLKEVMLMAKQRARFDAEVSSFNEMCWDVCVEKPGTKLDQKTATCLSNCVDRFIDVTLFIANRFTQSIKKLG